MNKHKFRQYQCNVCLFRSISIDHLIIHQMNQHTKNFEATFNPSINTDDIKHCKIIECSPLTNEKQPDLIDYYNNYKHERINSNLNMIQCCFCDYLDNDRNEVYAHCVAAHPDYPIIVFNGNEELSEAPTDATENRPRKRSNDGN